LQPSKSITEAPQFRVPKGYRAAGLQPKKCRAPGLQDGKFGALGLHCFAPGLHLAKNSIFVGAPSREKLWAPGSTTKISRL